MMRVKKLSFRYNKIMFKYFQISESESSCKLYKIKINIENGNEQKNELPGLKICIIIFKPIFSNSYFHIGPFLRYWYTIMILFFCKVSFDSEYHKNNTLDLKTK